MKRILIVSATKKTNYDLSKKIRSVLLNFDVEPILISVEDFILPVYSDSVYEHEKKKYSSTVKILTDYFVDAHAIIICGPEYNGSLPPVINNAIAWISVSTDYWKDAFKDKHSFIGTVSGGAGNKFLSTMKVQLDHLGSIVYEGHIIVNKSNPFDLNKSEKLLKQFIDLI